MKRFAEENSNTVLVSDETWHISNLKGDCLALICHMIVWFILLTLVENLALITKRCRKRRAKISIVDGLNQVDKENKIDDDVLTEAVRVRDICPEDLTVRVHNLRKDYRAACKRKNMAAVKNLSFGLDRGECFALLGVNGAGKSTTFKVLMNEISSSSGLVTIGSYDVRTDSEKTKKMIGYCP